MWHPILTAALFSMRYRELLRRLSSFLLSSSSCIFCRCKQASSEPATGVTTKPGLPTPRPAPHTARQPLPPSNDNTRITFFELSEMSMCSYCPCVYQISDILCSAKSSKEEVNQASFNIGRNDFLGQEEYLFVLQIPTSLYRLSLNLCKMFPNSIRNQYSSIKSSLPLVWNKKCDLFCNSHLSYLVLNYELKFFLAEPWRLMVFPQTFEEYWPNTLLCGNICRGLRHIQMLMISGSSL